MGMHMRACAHLQLVFLFLAPLRASWWAEGALWGTPLPTCLRAPGEGQGELPSPNTSQPPRPWGWALLRKPGVGVSLGLPPLEPLHTPSLLALACLLPSQASKQASLRCRLAHREQKRLCVAIKLDSLWEPEPVSWVGSRDGAGEGQGGSSGFRAPHPSWEGLGAQWGLLGGWECVGV